MKEWFKRSKTTQKQLSTMLSKTAVAEYNIRSISVKKGDTVRIMRGTHKGVEGRVTEVDAKRCFINVEGATREKTDGTVIFARIHPSKVAIVKLNLDDPRRKDIITRRAISRLRVKLE